MYRYLVSFVLILVFNCTGHISGKNSNQEKPHLVIGIVVDNLRYDLFLRYWDKFENNGIKRMIYEGTYCNNAQLNYFYTQTNPGLATIVTGTYPSQHGIVSNEWYNQISDKVIESTYDERANCIGCENSIEKHSAHFLISSTFGDEARLFSFNQSKVFAISMDASSATLLGGHLANAAFWMDNQSGKMVTSSAFTRELPQWVKDFNNKKIADIYLDQQWTLLYPDSIYARLNLTDNNSYENGIKGRKSFPYDLKSMVTLSNGKKDYNLLKSTPFGNNFIKDFAITTIVNENLGKGSYPDVLLINFNATEYIGQQFGLLSYEMEDAILRLDKDIAHLLSFLDSYLGKNNVVVFLTSNHGASYPVKVLKDMKMYADQFNPYEARVLLTSYLNVLYGKENWIKYWKGQQIYLNHQLIQNSKLDLQKFQEEVARFLIDFEGIAYVTTSMDTRGTDSKGVYQKLTNSFYQSRSGDIMYALLPDWTEVGESLAVHNTGYNYDTRVPLILYGWNIGRQLINRPVDIVDLAPTLSTFLQIPFPNNCVGTPIPELLK
jgi:predicted AlkP superfamily pyrophosphatase or phosphodiesterase